MSEIDSVYLVNTAAIVYYADYWSQHLFNCAQLFGHPIPILEIVLSLGVFAMRCFTVGRECNSQLVRKSAINIFFQIYSRDLIRKISHR